MCANLFKKPKVTTPKVEQVAPAPQAVSQNESAAMSDRAAAEAEKLRKRRGYNSTRVAEDRAVLTDAAQSGNRQTLG